MWYGLIPIIGAFLVRRTWRLFRQRFDDLRLSPILDYRRARALDGDGDDFRFFGGFESITEQTLWIRSDTLTVSVNLAGANVFLLPIEESGRFSGEGDTPRLIHWNQVAALSEGAKIFVGGRALPRDGRVRFESSKEKPLLVILYDGQERSLLMRVVRAGRQKNEYLNPVTPYAIALGIFSQVLMALSFVNRPAFSAAFSAALTGAFAPLLPFLPPGLLLTTLSRNIWRRGRSYRALRDLVRLPLRHLEKGETETILPDGSRYGVVRAKEETQGAALSILPRLPPDAILDSSRDEWYCYGALNDEESIVREPSDPSAVFAALEAEPEKLATSYSSRARMLEIAASSLIFTGTIINAIVAFRLIEFLLNS